MGWLPPDPRWPRHRDSEWMFIFEARVPYLRKWTTDGKQLPTTYPTGLMGADGTCDGEAAQCVNVISNDHSCNESTSWGLGTEEPREQQLGTSARCGRNHPNGLFQFQLMGRERCEATRGTCEKQPRLSKPPISREPRCRERVAIRCLPEPTEPLPSALNSTRVPVFLCLWPPSASANSAHKTMQTTVTGRSLKLGVMFKDNT